MDRMRQEAQRRGICKHGGGESPRVSGSIMAVPDGEGIPDRNDKHMTGLTQERRAVGFNQDFAPNHINKPE